MKSQVAAAGAQQAWLGGGACAPSPPSRAQGWASPPLCPHTALNWGRQSMQCVVLTVVHCQLRAWRIHRACCACGPIDRRAGRRAAGGGRETRHGHAWACPTWACLPSTQLPSRLHSRGPQAHHWGADKSKKQAGQGRRGRVAGGSGGGGAARVRAARGKQGHNGAVRARSKLVWGAMFRARVH